MGRFTASTASLLSLVAVGCTSVPLGDPARSAELKKFEVKPDVGQVYVCRGDAYRNGSRLSVQLDGKPLGRLLGNTFAYSEVTPGNHEAAATSPGHDSKIPFSVAAGEQRFFRAWFTDGFIYLWAFLEDVDVATGKACVEAGNLAAPPPVK